MKRGGIEVAATALGGPMQDYEQCDRLADCPFYHEVLPEMPALADRLMTRFCLGDWHACARKRAAEIMGVDWVPLDLFPNDHARLAKLLEERPDRGGGR